MKHLFCITAFLLLVPMTHAQVRTPKDSLRGLQGVYVNVLAIDATVQKGGVTTKQVQAKVEAQLRKAGIRIYETPRPAEGDANLTIIVDTIKNPQGVYVFKVGVSLVQAVRLTRDANAGAFPSETWSAVAIGLTTPRQLDIIYKPLEEKVDEFVKAYTAVNPKQK